MGNFNSGRRATTPDTDECLRLNLSELRREGAVKRFQMRRLQRSWSCRGERVAEVTIVVDIDCLAPAPCLRVTGWAFGRAVDQTLQIVAQSQPFGGERFYIICPITGRRCTSLIMPPGKVAFASVRGWNVPYASTREREVARAQRNIEKVGPRLRGMSKYTRKPTRARLTRRWERAMDIYWAFEEQLMARW